MRAKKNTIQVTFRVPAEWAERADNLVERILLPGATFGRNDAYRAALARGLDLYEAEERKGK